MMVGAEAQPKGVESNDRQQISEKPVPGSA